MKVTFFEIKQMKSFLVENDEPELTLGCTLVGHNQL